MPLKLKKSHGSDSNFELQITALIDTLVILLLFLLKSISTETLEMETGKEIGIATVNDGKMDGTGNRLEISKSELRWNGQTLAKLEDFQVNATGMAALKNAVETSAKEETVAGKFEGKLFLQADKSTPLSTIKDSLSIAKQVGYKDIKFVGAKIN